MLPTYLDCLFSFWVQGPNAAYVSGLFVFVLGPGPKCCLRIWIVCFRSASCAQMLPTYLDCLFSFWVLCPNAAYVSGLFVFVLGSVPKCCLRIWIVCFRSGFCAQMLPTYLDCLFLFWVLGPNAAYVSGLFVFVLVPGPKCCLRIWMACFRSGSWAQMLSTYLDCLFSFWGLGPNAVYVSGLFSLTFNCFKFNKK